MLRNLITQNALSMNYKPKPLFFEIVILAFTNIIFSYGPPLGLDLRCNDHHRKQHCQIEFNFAGIHNGDHFSEGSDLFVDLEFRDGEAYVEYAELYINGRKYGKVLDWPYRWGKGFQCDPPAIFNNMEPGRYRITCVILDKCGNKHQKGMTIYVDDYESCYNLFYNFEQYADDYPISDNNRWARLKNFHSPVVGKHNLHRNQTLKIEKGYGAAVDLGLLNYDNYEIDLFLYVPYQQTALIGLYDKKFHTVKGFSHNGVNVKIERWVYVKYLIDTQKKRIEVLLGNGEKETYYYTNDDIRYLVFHGVDKQHEFYIDDLYLKYGDRYDCPQ